ncbi:hypothetical protein [Nocardia sp. NPDC019255]|uniref:hypothetical protein n=1 Tax=Nocardia sp. NPDC019255 TaxID=3154591 RepID=UPI00340620F9
MTAKTSEAITVRLRPEDYEVLVGVAKLRNQQVADLARELILDGLHAVTDPAEIAAAIEAEKERLIRAIKQMRESQ